MATTQIKPFCDKCKRKLSTRSVPAGISEQDKHEILIGNFMSDPRYICYYCHRKSVFHLSHEDYVKWFKLNDGEKYV